MYAKAEKMEEKAMAAKTTSMPKKRMAKKAKKK